MIINNSPQNQAVLSNVGQIGEFRIRNSAKAFNILSSGLYANKIRAIIRELSCNAVDSHAAAGKQATPFDVHLPNTLEPWFSIRDYGTGLSHDQVTSIYTTYFESTKTDSNDFIGALGLGSKSPFSYTDNFTVTAVKDGRKGIYTAFINEHGVPSIALMHEEASTEPAGVEVKFSVNDRYDFDKFIKEASQVYTYFKLRPVVHGCKNFTVVEPNYKDRDIIKGVSTDGSYRSIAIMGNIAYPIDVPQTDSTLGNFRSLLDCGLVMEFDIGELDFQASREGLSYIPSTVQAIKCKLEALNNQLAIHIASEANQFANLWDRVEYLEKRYSEPLWKSAVIKYVQDTNLVLADTSNRYNLLKPFYFKVEELAKKYNINIRAFYKERHNDKCTTVKTESMWDDVTKTHVSAYKIWPNKNVNFVVTDTKRGSFERAKYHWRKSAQTNSGDNVFVLEAADKNRAAQFAKFLKDLYNPPRVINASQLLEKDRNSSGGNWGKASILKLEDRERRRATTYVWANAGTASEFDSAKTYYYVEMNHWTPVGMPCSNMADFYVVLTKSGVFTDDVYGVRKNDIELVRKQSNWVELNSHLRQKLSSMDLTNVMSLVKQAIDFKSAFKYSSDKINQDSPYYKLYAEFKDVVSDDGYKRTYVEKLLQLYGIKVNNVDPSSLISLYKQKVAAVMNRYPMLRHIGYYAEKSDVADYINMVDKVKGI